MNIIITGPQASGKGTQAEKLARILNTPHISIGDVLRAEAASGSALGKKLNDYMTRGELIPQELNDKIIGRVLKEHQNGIILDGYPRTQHQATFLDEHLDIDAMIVLRVPDEVCVERVSGRRVCPKGHDYHTTYNPPKKKGVCDIDGLPLTMREDDKPETVQHRLAIYHEETEPLIKHYKDKVIEIDGTPPIDEVHAQIVSAFSQSIRRAR